MAVSGCTGWMPGRQTTTACASRAALGGRRRPSSVGFARLGVRSIPGAFGHLRVRGHHLPLADLGRQAGLAPAAGRGKPGCLRPRPWTSGWTKIQADHRVRVKVQRFSFEEAEAQSFKLYHPQIDVAIKKKVLARKREPEEVAARKLHKEIITDELLDNEMAVLAPIQEGMQSVPADEVANAGSSALQRLTWEQYLEVRTRAKHSRRPGLGHGGPGGNQRIQEVSRPGEGSLQFESEECVEGGGRPPKMPPALVGTSRRPSQGKLALILLDYQAAPRRTPVWGGVEEACPWPDP